MMPPRYAGRRTHPVDVRRGTVVAGSRSLAVWQAGPLGAPDRIDELPVLPRPAPLY